jgi:hypothetical protein
MTYISYSRGSRRNAIKVWQFSLDETASSSVAKSPMWESFWFARAVRKRLYEYMISPHKSMYPYDHLCFRSHWSARPCLRHKEVEKGTHIYVCIDIYIYMYMFDILSFPSLRNHCLHPRCYLVAETYTSAVYMYIYISVCVYVCKLLGLGKDKETKESQSKRERENALCVFFSVFDLEKPFVHVVAHINNSCYITHVSTTRIINSVALLWMFIYVVVVYKYIYTNRE